MAILFESASSTGRTHRMTCGRLGAPATSGGAAAMRMRRSRPRRGEQPLWCSRGRVQARRLPASAQQKRYRAIGQARTIRPHRQCSAGWHRCVSAARCRFRRLAGRAQPGTMHGWRRWTQPSTMGTSESASSTGRVSDPADPLVCEFARSSDDCRCAQTLSTTRSWSGARNTCGDRGGMSMRSPRQRAPRMHLKLLGRFKTLPQNLFIPASAIAPSPQ